MRLARQEFADFLLPIAQLFAQGGDLVEPRYHRVEQSTQLAERVQLPNSMPVVKEKLRKDGHPPILTVMPQLRSLLSRYARVLSPGLHVLSQNEIPDRVGVNILGTLG
jgi:flagellar biosynthesis component FlhA